MNAGLVARPGLRNAWGMGSTAATMLLLGFLVPTLIVFADGDMSPPSHAAEMYEALGGGKQDGGWDRSGLPIHELAIIPGETHYSVGGSPKLGPVVLAFLDEGPR